MNNTQGIPSVELPDALKNAIELAQNRLSLLAGDEDRLRKLKISLETEVSSLDALKKDKESAIATLDIEIPKKEARITVLNANILDLSQQKDAAMTEAETAKANLDGVKALIVKANGTLSDVEDKIAKTKNWTMLTLRLKLKRVN